MIRLLVQKVCFTCALSSLSLVGCSGSGGPGAGTGDGVVRDHGLPAGDGTAARGAGATDLMVGSDGARDGGAPVGDALPAGEGTTGDAVADQVGPDSASPSSLPAELIDTPLQRTGGCSGGWVYYSQCVPGSPGRSDGCCYYSSSLGTPDSTIDFTVARLTDGSLELQVTGYTIDSSYEAVSLAGGETQPGHFVISPAKIKWPYGMPPQGTLQAGYDAGALSLSFSGTAQKSTTSYCPDESVSVQCHWE